MAISQVTVSGTFKRPDGSPSTGYVSFQLSSELSDGSSLFVTNASPQIATLSNGQFSIVLYATSEATTQPNNASYTVELFLDGETYVETGLGLPATPSTLNLAAWMNFNGGTNPGGVTNVAGGDLQGVYPNPTLKSIDGVVIVGSPSAANQALITTSTTSATWQAIPVIDATSTDIQPLGTQAAGSSGKAADAKHVHPTTGVLLSTNNLSDVASVATARTNLGLANGATATIDTTSTDITTSAVGDTAAAGAIGKLADAGHKHGREAFGTTASTLTVGGTQSAGTATTPSRSDHVHAMPTFSATTPAAIAGTGAVGTATTLSHSDHVHAGVSSLVAGSGINISGTGAVTVSVSSLVVLTSTTLGGDLSGTLPNPTVAKLNGITVTGTPSAGMILTATSTTAADWQTPASGAGVTLDTTAADIKPLGTQAAGTTGKASDAGHVHPTTGVVTTANTMGITGTATANYVLAATSASASAWTNALSLSGNITTTGLVKGGTAALGDSFNGLGLATITAYSDNSGNFGGALVENNNIAALALVNRGGTTYGNVNAGAYTVPFGVAGTGAVYTYSTKNITIGTNAGYTVRNTLDDGSGNVIISGNLNVAPGVSGNISTDGTSFFVGAIVGSGGGIVLRPNGAGSGTGQLILDSSGNITVSSNIVSHSGGDIVMWMSI